MSGFCKCWTFFVKQSLKVEANVFVSELIECYQIVTFCLFYMIFFTFYFGVECVNTQNIPLVMAMGVNRITYWSQGVASLSHKCQPPSPPLDNIWVMVIVWRLRGNIIRTAPCWAVWHNVHSQQHTRVQFLQVQQIEFVSLGPLRHA